MEMHAVYAGQKLKPLVKIGENIALLPLESYGFFQVIYIEPIQPFVHDFQSISAGSTLTEKQPQDSAGNNKMEVSENELAQFVITPLDDIEIQVFSLNLQVE